MCDVVQTGRYEEGKEVLSLNFDKMYNPVETALSEFDRIPGTSKRISVFNRRSFRAGYFWRKPNSYRIYSVEDQGYLIMNVQLPDGSTLGKNR